MSGLDRLRELDDALARRGASVETREDVRAELQRRAHAHPLQRRLRWWPVLAFAAGAVVMALTMSRTGHDPSAPESELAASPSTEEPNPDARSDDQGPAPATCDTWSTPSRSLALGDCVHFDGVEIRALAPSILARLSPDRVELRSGEALFDVTPRSAHPLRVHAGAVEIEVVGTRFVVRERDGVGWISMLEGEVRIHGGDTPLPLRAGERLDWPPRETLDALDTSGEATHDDRPERRRARPTKPDAQLATLLAEVADLRDAGDYAAAVAQLRAAQRHRWSPRARQLLSFEIGTMLERQLDDREAACAHWREHQRQFPEGRHDAFVSRSLVRLGCDD